MHYMKRLLSLIVLLTVVTFSFAQRTITMEKEGGIYKIPCTVNGAKMKMYFDTGASSVSLSMDIANYLYENDYIKKEDIIGKGKSYVASGDIVNHVVINLRDVEIGGMHLKNIEATVMDGLNVPLLLGQSAIQALGSITIRGNLLVINDAPKTYLTDAEVESLQQDYVNHMSYGSYLAARDCILKIMSARNINIAEYDALSRCYLECGQYDECLENSNKVLKRPEIDKEENSLYKDRAVRFIAECYYNKKQYDEAVLWYEKAMTQTAKNFPFDELRRAIKNLAMAYGRIGNKEKCHKTFNNLLLIDNMVNYTIESTKITSKKYKGVDFVQNLADDYMAIADACIEEIEDAKPSIPLAIALRMQCDYLGYDYYKVINGNQRGFNLKLGHILYQRGLYADDVEDAEKYIRLAEAWGDKDANKFLMKARADGSK